MQPMKRNPALTGSAGTYYVASRLALTGLNAAITIGNAPGVDILASLTEGNTAVAVQVKTSSMAWRRRVRTSKHPHDYEWDIGEKLARKNEPGLFVALVDLKDPDQNGQIDELPDVYIVSSTKLYDYFQDILQRGGKSGMARWMYWPLVEDIEPYKNRWSILENYLRGVLE